jgi:hypothetical protein
MRWLDPGDREKPRGTPLPHHPAYGSVPGGSNEGPSQPVSEGRPRFAK